MFCASKEPSPRAGTIKPSLVGEAGCVLAIPDWEEGSGEEVSPCGQRNRLEQGEVRINRIHPRENAEGASFPSPRPGTSPEIRNPCCCPNQSLKIFGYKIIKVIPRPKTGMWKGKIFESGTA